MRSAMAVLAAGLAGLIGAQQMPTIRVPVRLVNLPTLVFSNDSRLLTGLQIGDFRVLDNGRVQAAALDPSVAPVSVALAVQVNKDVRGYVPFIARVGSAIEALLVGESGEAAVITYGDEVKVVKPFDAGDVQKTLKKLTAGGKPARMLDAGTQALALLAERPSSRARVLLFIGQPMDSGSEATLQSLREDAEKKNVAVYAFVLPEFGKDFVSDTVSLEGVSKGEGGGLRTGVDLGRLVSVLNRSSSAEAGTDPFSILTSATGGTQLHFRKQRELEDDIAAIGVELRSAYVLSYHPDSEDTGYHTIQVQVNVPGARVYARPGYWMRAE
jgi:VWFA-related protein